MNGCRVDCIAEGVFSLLGVVPRCVIDGSLPAPSSPDDLAAELEPTMVHLTACRSHLPAVRQWLLHLADPIREIWPEVDMDPELIVCSTDYLRMNWDYVQDGFGPDLPIHSMIKVAV